MQNKLCGDTNHWQNVILFGGCWKCKRELATFIPAEQQHKPMTEAEVNGIARLQGETDLTVDAVIGVGDEMERSESWSEGYRNAH